MDSNKERFLQRHWPWSNWRRTRPRRAFASTWASACSASPYAHYRDLADEANQTPRIKGAVIVDQLRRIEERFGSGPIDAAMARLSPAHRRELEGMVSISWLDVDATTALKSLIAEEVGMTPLSFQRLIVREAIGDTVNKVWRVVLKSLWDRAIIKRAPMLYSRAFDRGEMRAETHEPGYALFVLEGWPNMPEYNCEGLATGMEHVLELSGRHGVRVQWRRDAPRVLFEARWQAR